MHPPTRAETSQAQLRFAVIRSEISGRLWAIRTGMSNAAFNSLVDEMSLLQLNAESRDVGGPAHVETRLSPLDRRNTTACVPLGGYRLLP